MSESKVKPTTLLYRNFLAMETEELFRSHPLDGAVLMGGCDKTTPGLLMGAISMGLRFAWVGRCGLVPATRNNAASAPQRGSIGCVQLRFLESSTTSKPR